MKVSEPVVIPLNEWMSQRVLSKVVGRLIERQGIPVRYQDIAVADQWGALRKGVVHFQVEVWQPSMAKTFESMVEKGYILDLGAHNVDVREEWWYPSFVEKLCPGLPDWKALKNCSELFANAPGEKGIYYTGPWYYADADLIRALELNFDILRFNTSIEMWQVLKESVAKKRPILMLNWKPNWTDLRLSGRFVEFPEYTPECETEPGWGINPYLLRDCGNPIKGWLKKAVWPGLQEKWPCVFKLVERLDFNKEMIADAAALVVADGYSEDVAVTHWLNKYKTQNVEWMNFICF